MSGDKDFLSRWSARKREARDAENAPEPAAPASPDAAPEIPLAEIESLSDAELCERLDLPDPATLKAGDDFRVFLETRVPERLRRAALRQLWRSNPIFNRLDDLDDYNEDFRAAGASAETLQTLYRVGKGFAKPDEDAAPDGATSEAGESGALAADSKNAAMREACAPECDSGGPGAEEGERGDADSPSESPVAAAKTECGRPPQITSRRMSFRFVEKPNKRA